MTPAEWAEVFAAGKVAARYALDRGAGVPAALMAMEEKCTEIDRRDRGPKEDQFMGKPVSELTYQEAVMFRQYMTEGGIKWVSENTSKTISLILAGGPEPDRPDPIAILPPTIIEGGQHVGKP